MQPIVLLIDKTAEQDHLDAVRAVAVASVRAYAKDLHHGGSHAWEPWLAGQYGKTVRRATPKSFAAFAGDDTTRVGTATAIAFSPTLYSEMPKNLTSLQVSGTDLPHWNNHTPGEQGAPRIVLNGELGMTTGKAAAQGAHALLLWFLSLNVSEREAWLTENCPVTASEVNYESFTSLMGDAIGQVVIDAGHTEIDPETPTAFILRSQP